MFDAGWCRQPKSPFARVPMTPREFRARLDRIDAFRERCIGIAIIEISVGACLLLLYRGIIRPLSILMQPSKRRSNPAAKADCSCRCVGSGMKAALGRNVAENSSVAPGRNARVRAS
jgi:hypothetical protein